MRVTLARHSREKEALRCPPSLRPQSTAMMTSRRHFDRLPKTYSNRRMPPSDYCEVLSANATQTTNPWHGTGRAGAFIRNGVCHAPRLCPGRPTSAPGGRASAGPTEYINTQAPLRT